MTDGKKLRLIFRGRQLRNSDIIASVGIQNNDFLHCALSPAESPPRQDAVTIPVRDIPDASQPNVLGFDSLRAQGFSEEDVGSLRSIFSLEISSLVEATPQLEGESDEEMRRRIETAWIQSHIRRLGSAAQRTSLTTSLGRDLEGSYADIILGFALGFVLGFVMMFWVGDNSISHGRRLGIMLGVSANVAWSFVHHSHAQDRSPIP